MSDKLNIEIKTRGDITKVLLSGQIDEDANFDIIKNVQGQIEFDFDGINLINSCGVREWINFIESIERPDPIFYANCPQVVIEQINMVHGFIGKNTKVTSFYAPYYNEETDEVLKVLLTHDQIKDGKAPSMKSESGDELEFDAIEAQYFQFLKQVD